MDNKMKELLLKMKELGISEEEFRKTLNSSSKEDEEKPADKEKFEEIVKLIRLRIEKIISLVFSTETISNELLKVITTPALFKLEFRELADAEVVRVVKFLDDISRSYECIEDKAEAQSILLSKMVSYEDVVFGNIVLFKAVPVNILYDFAQKIGMSKAHTYAIVKQPLENNNIAKITSAQEIKEAKQDMLNLMATLFRDSIGIYFDEKYIKEFVRLINLKDFIFTETSDKNDVFVMYGVAISMLLVVGLNKTRSIMKLALDDIRKSIKAMKESDELLSVLGESNGEETK